MVEPIRAEATEQIHLINDAIHDWVFDVEEIQFDPQEATLRIRFVPEEVYTEFQKSGKCEGLPVGRQLVLFVKNVLDYKISDTEKIRYYDLNIVSYDQKTKVLQIIGCIPFKIQVHVSDLLLELS